MKTLNTSGVAPERTAELMRAEQALYATTRARSGELVVDGGSTLPESPFFNEAAGESHALRRTA